MTSWSLFAKSFVMILIDQLSSDIGLKSLGVVGASFLGMRVINEELMLCKLILP